MAVVKFNRKEFEKQIKITSEIEEKISFFGTPLESLTKDVVEIEIFPNRPDLLSLQGYLRSFKSFLGKGKTQKYKIYPPEKNYKVIIDQSVKPIRPFTACAIVKNLSLNDEKIKEIINIQEKLHSTLGRNRKNVAIGIYPLDKIKLPIKYTANNPQDIKFIPLEEKKEMNSLQILQRTPAGREYAHLLEGKNKFPIFIDANNKILSMPPIINSHETGKININTNNVFVECSGYNFDILKKTLNIIITTLSDLGGKVYSMDLIYKKKERTPDLTPEKMKISLDNTNKLLGLNLKEKNLKKLLPKMEYTYNNKSVFIPAWRTDILHEVDIIEDIAIAYGYDKFIPEVPVISTVAKENYKEKFKNKINDILIGLSFLEILSYHLIKQEEAKTHKIQGIEVLDSKTDYKILRPNLLIPSLRTLAENKDNEYPQKIFEIGVTFSKNEKEDSGVKETDSLIISSSPGNFTELKQVLNYLSRILKIQFELIESNKQGMIEGRTASINLENKEIGYIAEAHPTLLKNSNIKMPVALIEISLEEIYKKLEKK